ncbi:MAG TPA: D-alanyl-D-alanine endopeptidase, partial [Steroidobacteraceae bacterium]|nr:D-alanyl-D-alanine endopeptidase [Steroidobacteraceae bacterium]
MHSWRRALLALLLAPALTFASPAGTASDAVKPLHLGKLDVRSSSVIVLDAVDSSVLYSKQSERVVPIASITKLMTALVVLDADQPLDEMIELSVADRRLERSSASRLAIGNKLSRSDLLHLALMSSENRAAHAVARAYPGGLPACIKAMNAKARALGMKSARFTDPTGLSSGNVSSAADLAKLVAAAAANPTIRMYSTSASHTVAVGRHLLEFRNTNSLVKKADWDVLLQKTGYTSDAGQCLAMKTVIRERPVLIVLLNSFGKYTRVADARRIRKWMEAGAEPGQLAQAA